MPNAVSDTPQVIIFPPLLYVGLLLLASIIQVLYPLPILPRALTLVLGLIGTGGGLALLLVVVRVMLQSGTNINPNQPTTILVVTGPFRFSRNPMYLAFTLLYSGIAMLANVLWAVLLLPIILAVLRYGVISREEEYLERKFGAEYMAYKSRVRRWI